MSTYETIAVRVDDRGVAYVELNRPSKRNAMSAQMISELTEMAKSVGENSKVRAVVLSGAGDVFCAGGDLDWMKAQMKSNREVRMREARTLAEMLKTLNEMHTPLIGKVHGGAFGGGIGLMSICDTVVARDDTKFGLTETRLGLIPATIGPYVFARIGEGMARRIFMSARIFRAQEAQELGLVSVITNSEELDAAVEAQVRPYLSVAPNAVGAAKALARALGPRIDDAVIDDTIQRLADIWEGEEAKEGIDAFLNKRPAMWAQ